MFLRGIISFESRTDRACFCFCSEHRIRCVAGVSFLGPVVARISEGPRTVLGFTHLLIGLAGICHAPSTSSVILRDWIPLPRGRLKSGIACCSWRPCPHRARTCSGGDQPASIQSQGPGAAATPVPRSAVRHGTVLCVCVQYCNRCTVQHSTVRVCLGPGSLRPELAWLLAQNNHVNNSPPWSREWNGLGSSQSHPCGHGAPAFLAHVVSPFPVVPVFPI